MLGCAEVIRKSKLYTQSLSFYHINKNFKTVMIPNISKGLGLITWCLDQSWQDLVKGNFTICVTLSQYVLHIKIWITYQMQVLIIQQANSNIKKLLETLTEIYMKNVIAIPFIIVKKNWKKKSQCWRLRTWLNKKHSNKYNLIDGKVQLIGSIQWQKNANDINSSKRKAI